MIFPVSGVQIHPLYLIGVGFLVGLLGGFFGVGGSFLAGPALFAVGLPMNFVVGTDLAHIVGKSIVAARKHHALGNIDLRLGLILAVTTVGGVEAGAQLIQVLKRAAHIDWVVGGGFIVILTGISAFMTWEVFKTSRARVRTRNRGQLPERGKPLSRQDHSALRHIAQAVHRINLPPHVDLPVSGIRRVSIWPLLGVGFASGLFSGFLGGGAGYIRMPCLVYLLGIPTHIAVGTDLFEIIISAGYGTFTHAWKGNVDILIALVMHTGAAIGAQAGASLTQYVGGPRLRMAFVPLPLIGAAILLRALLAGHPTL